MSQQYGLLIGGRWTDGDAKATIESRSPVDGSLIGTFPKAGAKEVAKAVTSAVEAYPAWRRTPAPRRGELLLEAARILRQRKQQIGTLVSREMGKVISEGLGEVQEAIDFIEYAAGEGRRLFGLTTPSELPDKILMTRRDPLGPVGLISPWNFPVAIPSWKSGAALVAGNTCVFKPASTTPACAAEYVRALVDAGLPPGVMNFVVGPGEVVGDAIVSDERIKAVSFTGGTEAGAQVYQKAAARMVACGLELGGKNPMIVMDDANLDLALEGATFGAFGTSGQRCTATSRLLLHKDIHDEFLDRLVHRIESFKVGDPVDPATDMGPVHSASQKAKVLSYVAIGKKEAELVTGGHALESGALKKGHFVEPTIFTTKHGTRISKEEIFGPVLSVIKVKDLNDAVTTANDVIFGLSSSIYTENVNNALKAVDRLDAGITYVNAPTIGAETHVPFGGIKATGPTHTREGGPTAIDEFTVWKTVIMEYSGRLQKAQIDTAAIVDGAPKKAKK